jgi:hypothetical protein
MGRLMRKIMGNITNYNHLYPIWVSLKIRYSRHMVIFIGKLEDQWI